VAFNERLEIVELNAANEAVSLLNLNDGVHYMMEAGTFEPIPPEPTAVLSADQRRYGGARQVGEVHATNGSIEWVAGVTATTEQAALEKVEALLTQLAANPYHSYVLWQVPGATYPTLYAMRGTGTWQPKYSVATLEGAQLFLFQVHVPVAPLAQGLPLEATGAVQFLPDVIAIPNLFVGGVPGDAPALAEISVEAGTAPEDTFITGASRPEGVAVNAEHIYWTNETTGYIGRATLAGTEVNRTWLKVEGKPVALAVDSGHIYWGDAETKDIGRATLAGGTVERAWIAAAFSKGAASGIAVNSEHIYWTNQLYIGRATIAGGTIEKEWLKTEGLSGYSGIALNATYIYWTASIGGSVIGRAKLNGEEPSQFWLSGVSAEGGLAVNSQYIYWAWRGGGYIGRAELGGTAANGTWLNVGANPTGIALIGSFVYWTNQTTGDIGRGSASATVGSPPIWALLGWATKPTTGLAVPPFGILDSATASEITGWTYKTTAGARTGGALVGSVVNAAAYWQVDPATMTPDSFSGELAVEVWARVLLSAGLSSANLTLSAQPQDGVGYGAARYTDEWGSSGRPLSLPEGSDRWRMTRLGTLHLLCNPLAPRIWKLVVEGSSIAAAEWGLDYLLVVPSMQRACSPSSKPNNAAYPPFIANVGATVKTIRSNLSGLIAEPGKNGHPDHGLGGQLLEVPPGESELLVKLSSLVPDDPTVSAASEQLAYESQVRVLVTPRWFLARTV
jgi:hypothetical protein